MKYNIIGDIHGRKCWMDLIREDCVNVFVGDYFSPYDNIPFQEQMKVFWDIVTFKNKHPETVLLIGNHDEDHWHINERYSRFDSLHFQEIYNTFEENKDLLQVAYSIDNKILVTHAGMSCVWYNMYKNNGIPVLVDLSHLNVYNSIGDAVKERLATLQEKVGHEVKLDGSVIVWNNSFWTVNNEVYEQITVTPDEAAKFINELWRDKNYGAFNFINNADPLDGYGNSNSHGPLWIRPENLLDTNMFRFSNHAQIVGHTRFTQPILAHRGQRADMDNLTELTNLIAFIDCLGTTTASLIYDSDNNKFEVNKIS